MNGTFVFDKVAFGWVGNNRQFPPDIYTRFKNRIGLTDGSGELLSASNDVILSFPYKDCVLEGGQTKEEQKRAEEAGEYVNLEPRIYPEPEVTEWRNEILQQYFDRRGGTPKEVELEYFDKKLAEWKKTADPARVKKLEEKTKQIIQRKYITV